MNKTIKTFGVMPLVTALMLLTFAFGQNVSAQVVTFAQFLEKNGTQDFVFTNSGLDGAFSTVPGGSPIDFRYQNITNGLPAELNGFQDAHLFITTVTTTPASLSGSNLTQPFDSMTTISIIRDTPASPGVGTGTRTNLLTATFSTAAGNPTLSGGVGGNSATLSGATPSNNVVFSSDFIGFGLTTQRGLGLSFSSVLPSYSAGAGGFIQDFTAAGTGTFSSNPPPGYFPPTAASVSVSGRITNVFGSGISRAVVVMTDGNGVSRQAMTNHFGYYSFTDVQAGETYLFDVESKGHYFPTQVVNVDDEIRNLDFSYSPFR